MDSFVKSSIKIKGGELSSHPSIDLKAFVGISHEHIHRVKSLYRDLSNEELQDFDFCIVFEAKNEESASDLQELIQSVINLWTSDSSESRSIRRIQRTIAVSEDEEYHKNPKFFPKVSRHGIHVIAQFLPIRGFREVLQSTFTTIKERFPEGFNIKQEITLNVQAGKKYGEIKSSERSLPELLGSFILDASLSLSKPLVSGFTDYLDEKGRKLQDLGALLSLFALGNHANIDLKFEDLNHFEETVMEYFINELPLHNKFRDVVCKVDMKTKIRDFLKSVSQHAHDKFKLFATSPMIAFSAELCAQDLLRDLVKDDESEQ